WSPDAAIPAVNDRSVLGKSPVNGAGLAFTSPVHGALTRNRPVVYGRRRTVGVALAATVLIAPSLLPPAAPAQRTRDQFVATFETDEKLQGQMGRLKQLAGQKAWGDWTALYQQVMDERPDGVVPVDAERFEGVHLRLERMFAQLPADARQLYRTRF